MIMLTGIKAFEARWQSLKAVHPTSPRENHLLMQSMGRLVDNYASQAELTTELPTHLRSMFAHLVEAYLNGYWVDGAEDKAAAKPAAMTPAVLAAKQRRQKKTLTPTVSSEAATYIIHERARCWA
ncbi:MAG: hypothetical protein AAFO84_12490 [Cyanobacteria bacterium J06598_1]